LHRALVIMNPIAGRGAGQHVLGGIEHGLRERGIEFDTSSTSQAGDARDAARRADDYDTVVVIGGDGTLNEVINGLEADRPVALFPLGTGNVLGKELRLPRRVPRFCAMLAAGHERVLDLGRIGERHFVSMAGAGFDAVVATALHEARDGAIRMTHYLRPLARCMTSYRFPLLHVTIDGGEPIDAGGFALVSNVRAYGGPLVPAPDAVPDDGLLDVCVLPHGSRLAYLRALAAFFLGLQHTLSGAHYYRGRSVTLSADERVPYQVDGDPAGLLPATAQLSERKLRVVVP